MLRSKRSVLAAAVLTALGGGLLSATPAQSTDAASAAAARVAAAARPNVVFILSDDMRVDDLRFAPNVRKIIGRQGVTFDNSFSPFPLCCPARASFLTGQYAHNHKVYWHEAPFGYGAFDDRKTIGTSMHAAGYSTGFIGKYLNLYGVARSRISGRPSYKFVPPGWDYWQAAVENPHNAGFHGSTYNYFDTPFNVNGRIVNKYRGRYQSDVIGDMSIAMAKRFSKAGKPFFMDVNYVAPHHGGPHEADDPKKYTPSAGRGNVVLVTPARPKWVRGKFDSVIRRGAGIAKRGEKVERDMSDKPRRFRRSYRTFSAKNLSDIREVTRQRAESVYVMDKNIGRLVTALKKMGEWDNTVLVFTSDNGLLLGEHGQADTKVWTHEPSLRVPTLVTGPGMRSGEHRYDPISTVDLTATILDIADAAPPHPADGISRLPELQQGDHGWSTAVLMENINTATRPRRDKAFRDRRSGIGVRTSRYSYTRYADRAVELYDLVKDPRENRSVAHSARYRNVRRALDRVWRQLKDCDGAECRVQLPPLLAADTDRNAGNTRAYWHKLHRYYSW
ncbi:MAG TPA: sulfatase [Nocardioides sp.]|nr:sulfatase [Nocardioides sp.]